MSIMPLLPARGRFLALALGFAMLAGGAALLVPRGLFAQAFPVAAVDTERLAGVAISGHDAVSYFREGKPVSGKAAITYRYMGAEWRFASEANRAAFAASPAAYAPQFGGYCAWAVSNGYTASGDPEAWAIRDGRLYLNYSKEVQATWSMDIAGNIARGNANWPKLIVGK